MPEFEVIPDVGPRTSRGSTRSPWPRRRRSSIRLGLHRVTGIRFGMQPVVSFSVDSDTQAAGWGGRRGRDDRRGRVGARTKRDVQLHLSLCLSTVGECPLPDVPSSVFELQPRRLDHISQELDRIAARRRRELDGGRHRLGSLSLALDVQDQREPVGRAPHDHLATDPDRMRTEALP